MYLFGNTTEFPTATSLRGARGPESSALRNLRSVFARAQSSVRGRLARISAERARAARLLAELGDADGYTAAHCSRVGAIAAAIADELGIGGIRREELVLAASLHDLGKADLPADVLQKDGPLSPEERKIMESHVQAGERRAAEFSPVVREIIAQHHERADGRGYPRRLAGEAIRLEARVVAVADAFDAMTSDRCYRRGRPAAEALVELRRCARPEGSNYQFDPRVVEALARRFDEIASLCEGERRASIAA